MVVLRNRRSQLYNNINVRYWPTLDQRDRWRSRLGVQFVLAENDTDEPERIQERVRNRLFGNAAVPTV